MRNITLILILILAAIYAGLSIVNSGDEYSGERAYYFAMKGNEEIVKNPDLTPPAVLARVESSYKSIIKEHPKSRVVKPASIGLVEFYVARKRYSEALSNIEVIKKNYPDDVMMMSTAIFLKGAIREKQGKWDLAMKEFKILEDKYPTTQIGMQIPMYIGQHYSSKGDDAKAAKAYADAAALYSALEKQYSGKMIGYMAATYLLQAYILANSYDEAGRTLEWIFDKYPSTGTYVQLLPVVEIIYLDKTKNPARAVEIYKSVRDKTKDSALKKSLDSAIQKVGKIK